MPRTLILLSYFLGTTVVMAAELSPADLPHIVRFDQYTTAYLYRAGGQTLSEQLNGTPLAQATETHDAKAWLAELDRMGTLDRKGVLLYRFIRQAYKASHVYTARIADPLDPEGEPFTLPEIGQHHLAIITPAPDEKAALLAALKALRTTTDADEMRDSGEKLMLGYDGWRLHLQPIDDSIAWAMDADLLEALLLPPIAPLAESEHFNASVKPLLAGQDKLPIALYYYDLRPLWQPLDDKQYKLWNDLSWRAIDALSGATFVQDGRLLNRHYWKLGKQRAGLFRKIQDHPLRRDWFKAVPEDATLVVSGVGRLTSFMMSLRLLSIWIEGAENAISMNLELPQQMAPMAMYVQAVGSRYLLYRQPTRYTSGFFAPGLLPGNDMVVLVELADRNYFVESMSSLIQSSDYQLPHIQQHQFDGVAVYGLPFGLFTLYVANVDDIGVLTTSGQLMKDALERIKQIKQPAVEPATPVLAALAPVPEDACFFAFAPPGGIVGDLYETYAAHLVEMPGLRDFLDGFRLQAGVGAAPEPQQNPTGSMFDLLSIPRGHVLGQCAKQPTTLVGRDLGDGILFEGRSDLIAMPLLVTHWHALTRFHNAGLMISMATGLEWLMTPAEPNDSEKSERGQ